MRIAITRNGIQRGSIHWYRPRHSGSHDHPTSGNRITSARQPDGAQVLRGTYRQPFSRATPQTLPQTLSCGDLYQANANHQRLANHATKINTHSTNPVYLAKRRKRWRRRAATAEVYGPPPNPLMNCISEPEPASGFGGSVCTRSRQLIGPVLFARPDPQKNERGQAH